MARTEVWRAHPCIRSHSHAPKKPRPWSDACIFSLMLHRLQYALTRRTSILANALGPCGLLGSDRTSSSNSNSGNNTSSSASALQLQSRAQGQGQPTGQLQAQGQAVSQGQGQDQARALPDPFECPPKRIRDVPPVAKWDMQWREWALSAKSQGRALPASSCCHARCDLNHAMHACMLPMWTLQGWMFGRCRPC